MAKLKYNLNNDEKIVYKTSCVRHGFWGAYTNSLIVTNQAVILEKYGMLNNFKGIERYSYDSIKQAIQGEATNGQKQLELYIGDKVEDFALQSGDENELKMLVMAINDQMGTDAEYFDYNYYKKISMNDKEINRLLELRAMAGKNDDGLSKSNLNIAKDATKNVIKSNDYTLNGIKKSINKAAKKEKRKGILGEFMNEVMDDFGIYDIQDMFTEIGNDFREDFGLGHKMTHKEEKELEELEKKQRKKEIQQLKERELKNKIDERKQYIESQKRINSEENNSNIDKYEEIKKLKELLDMNIITQEEFDKKKKELLNL